MASEHLSVRGELTVGLVKKLQAERVEREIFLADGSVRGLFLYLRPAAVGSVHPNRAAWFIRWCAGKTSKKMSLGDARSLTLDAARKAARAHLATVAKGGDPAADRRAKRDRNTVRELWDAYTADRVFTSKTESTQYKDRNRFTLHASDRIGSKLVDELDRTTVEGLIGAIQYDDRVGRRGRRLGGVGAAKKTMRLLAAVAAWGLKHGLVRRNPFTGHDMAADGVRTEIVEGQDFRALFSTIDKAEADGVLTPIKARALRVIWATGARLSEITDLRWRHVRLDDTRIVFPAAEHKGGRVAARRGRQGVSRVIDLPPVAYDAIVAQLPATGLAPEPDALVFPPLRGGSKHLELGRSWREVRKRAGLPTSIVMHTARHSLGTAAALAGMSVVQIGGVLGHAQARTTERYANIARSRAQRLGNMAFAAAMGEHSAGNQHPGGDNVPFNKR